MFDYEIVRKLIEGLLSVCGGSDDDGDVGGGGTRELTMNKFK